jgi:hypothetical protein
MRAESSRKWLELAWPVLVVALAGCGLSASQRQSISLWEAEAADLGHPEIRYAEELSPGTALGLGFLPFGIAGFYVHRPGMAVSGILLWPLSVTWTPSMARRTAYEYNFRQFREKMLALREEVQAHTPVRDPAGAALDRIETLRREGKISDSEYQEGRRKIIEGLGPPIE